jgi:hypothetical protein
VIAVCGHSVVLLAKQPDEGFECYYQGEGASAPSLVAFSDVLLHACDARRFNQLLLVGSASDIAWIRSVIPEAVCYHISAESHVPLQAEWFTTPPAKDLYEAVRHCLCC